MSSAHLLVVVVAVTLLGAFHLAFAGGARVRALSDDFSAGRDPWTRLLALAAAAAVLFALGVVGVPALFDDDESESTLTRPTVTTPTGRNGGTATTVPTRTTVPTTTAATTTTPEPPPPGAIVLARAKVEGATARLRQGMNRLDGRPPVVRAAGLGVYRVVVPGLTAEARRRIELRVTAGPSTLAVAKESRRGSALVVWTRDRETRASTPRDFTLVVYGSSRDVPRDDEMTLPETT